jgi:hypothetical protein
MKKYLWYTRLVTQVPLAVLGDRINKLSVRLCLWNLGNLNPGTLEVGMVFNGIIRTRPHVPETVAQHCCTSIVRHSPYNNGVKTLG